MAYIRKTRDEYEIQGYISGYGREIETTEETWKAAKAQAKCYRENVNYPIRIIKKRIRIENNNK